VRQVVAGQEIPVGSVLALACPDALAVACAKPSQGEPEEPVRAGYMTQPQVTVTLCGMTRRAARWG